jgi:hypothetical protein
MNKLIRRPVSLLSLAFVAALAGCAAPGTPTAGDAPTPAGGTNEMGAPGTTRVTPRGPSAAEPGGGSMGGGTTGSGTTR